MAQSKLSALGTETTFTLSDFLVKVKAAGAGDVIVTLTNFLAAIFSGQLQSYTNAGSAGGTFHYINLGGIKFLWGTTGTVSISGSGIQQSAAVAITLPTSFFSSIQAVFPTPGTAASGTNAISADVQALSTSSISVVLSQSAGTAGAAGISLFVIGA